MIGAAAAFCLAGMHIRRWAWGIVALGAAPALLAQQGTQMVFQPVASPTTANLRAITVSETLEPDGYESNLVVNQFVAVGDGGAIVTSADGGNWSLASAPVAANLYGVTANSEATYVAVGADGTVLTSSDATDWLQQPSGTSADLRAVASDGSHFMAVGENGTVCTSSDGFHWTAASTGVGATLNAVIFAGGTWLIVGDHGTLLSSTDGITFQIVPSGTTQNLTAITSVPTEPLDGQTGFNVAQQAALPVEFAGSGGTLGTYDGIHAPQLISGGEGDYTGAGSLPGSFAESGFVTAQGQIQGAPAPIQLPNGIIPNAIGGDGAWVAVGDGGAIWSTAAWNAAFPSNGLTGIGGLPSLNTAIAGRSLTLQAPTGLGASYQWWLQSQPLAGGTSAMLSLPSLSAASSGTYSVTVTSPSVAAEYSAVLTVEPAASYSPDLVDAISTPLSLALADGTFVSPDGFVIQPDGKWLLEWQNQFDPTGEYPAVFVRLNPDGSVDGGFNVPPGLAQANSVLVPLPNGKIVMAWTRGPKLGDPLPGGALGWARLNSDGSEDTTFPIDAEYFNGANSLAGGLAASGDAAGDVYLAVTCITENGTQEVDFTRLDTSQEFDPTFAGGNVPGTAVVALQATGVGLLYAVEEPDSSVVVGRLTTGGLPDGSFAIHSFPAGTLVAFASDGTTTALVPAPSLYSATAYAFVGLNANGTQNANVGGFVAGDPYTSSVPAWNYSDAAVFTPFLTFNAIGGGEFLISGFFGSVNMSPVQDSLAVVHPDTEFAATRLVNLSVRGEVTAEAPLTVGGYVGGAGTIAALLRGVGPTLANYGVADPLPDPEIQLYEGQMLVASNDNWSSNGVIAISDAEQAVGAFPLPADSLDAALVASLTGGPFSLIATGKGGSGVTLGEVYNSNAPPTDVSQARLTNVSALAQTAPGAQQLTVGFVIGGPDSRQLLIRAVGPGLLQFGVSGAPDPVLTLYSGSNVVASNIGWGTGPDAGSVSTAASQVGAFALTVGSADSALLVVLPPGDYTAAVGTTSGNSGLVLLEVYEVP